MSDTMKWLCAAGLTMVFLIILYWVMVGICHISGQTFSMKGYSLAVATSAIVWLIKNEFD